MKITVNLPSDAAEVLSRYARINNCTIEALVMESLDDFIQCIIPARVKTAKLFEISQNEKHSDFSRGGTADLAIPEPSTRYIN